MGFPGASAEAKPDLAAEFETAMKNMTERVDKKLKFSTLAALPTDVAVRYAPITFMCSPPRKCPNATVEIHQRAENCPPGIYLKDYKLFNADGTAIPLPTSKFQAICNVCHEEKACVWLIPISTFSQTPLTP
jgi:hypothetical protein